MVARVPNQSARRTALLPEAGVKRNILCDF
jgi:hypothetical protein